MCTYNCNSVWATYIHIYIYCVKKNGGKVAQPERTGLQHFVPGHYCVMQWLQNSILGRLCSACMYIYICIAMYIYICIY